MKKRTITIIAEFDMSEFKESEITDRKKVKLMVMEAALDRFAEDEGFESITVDVIDE